MTTTEDTTTKERGSRAGSAHESDNAVRGRANAWFFVAMDRYINWVAPKRSTGLSEGCRAR